MVSCLDFYNNAKLDLVHNSRASPMCGLEADLFFVFCFMKDWADFFFFFLERLFYFIYSVGIFFASVRLEE